MKQPARFITLLGHGDETEEDGTPSDAETAATDEQATNQESDTSSEAETQDNAEKSNAPIEVPDTTNLAIDKIIEETDDKKQEELRQQQAERVGEIEESLDEASLIGTAVESYLLDVQRNKVDPFMTLGILNSIRRRQGAQAVSMESFKASGSCVVVENFKNAHDVVVAKIVEATEAIRQSTVRQLKSLAQEITSINSQQLQSIERISDAQQNGQISLGVAVKKRLSVSGAYFANAQMQQYDQYGSPTEKLSLQPHEHVARARSLLNALEFFEWNESVGFCDTLQQLMHRFSAGNHTDTSAVTAPLPEPEALLEKMKTSRVAYIDGIRSQDDRSLHASQHYLGGVSFILELDQETWGQDPLSRLAAMGAWRSQFVCNAGNVIGTEVRFLTKHEVQECQKQFDALAVKISGLMDFADRYDRSVSELGKAILRLSGKSGEVLAGEDQLERQQLQLIALKACAAWLINSTNTASFLCEYFAELNRAWSELLKTQVANQKNQ